MSKENSLIEEIISLSKRRGFVFQSSEIYGGLNGFFDYGPLGVELRKNIKDVWWEDMVRRRDDMVGLDSSIIMNPRIWKASGHVDGFTDPMVDCKESKMRYRADQLFAAEVLVEDESLGWLSVLESETMEQEALKMAESLKRKAAKQGSLKDLKLRSYDELTASEQELVPSPATGKPGSLTPPREFNMMFETHVGALRDGHQSATYGRKQHRVYLQILKILSILDGLKFPLELPKLEKLFAMRLLLVISFFVLGSSSRWRSNTSFHLVMNIGPAITGNGLM